jgi:hypothetical protein
VSTKSGRSDHAAVASAFRAGRQCFERLFAAAVTRGSVCGGGGGLGGAPAQLVACARGKHEHLDREVGVNVALAHEGGHLAIELAFDDSDELIAHDECGILHAPDGTGADVLRQRRDREEGRL